jgi:hypothetical protein
LFSHSPAFHETPLAGYLLAAKADLSIAVSALTYGGPSLLDIAGFMGATLKAAEAARRAAVEHWVGSMKAGDTALRRPVRVSAIRQQKLVNFLLKPTSTVTCTASRKNYSEGKVYVLRKSRNVLYRDYKLALRRLAVEDKRRATARRGGSSSSGGSSSNDSSSSSSGSSGSSSSSSAQLPYKHVPRDFKPINRSAFFIMLGDTSFRRMKAIDCACATCHRDRSIFDTDFPLIIKAVRSLLRDMPDVPQSVLDEAEATVVIVENQIAGLQVHLSPEGGLFSHTQDQKTSMCLYHCPVHAFTNDFDPSCSRSCGDHQDAGTCAGNSAILHSLAHPSHPAPPRLVPHSHLLLFFPSSFHVHRSLSVRDWLWGHICAPPHQRRSVVIHCATFCRPSQEEAPWGEFLFCRRCCCCCCCWCC